MCFMETWTSPGTWRGCREKYNLTAAMLRIIPVHNALSCITCQLLLCEAEVMCWIQQESPFFVWEVEF